MHYLHTDRIPCRVEASNEYRATMAAAGDWFDICSCNIPCPCEFAQAPTNNACLGMLVWHIREGNFGDVGLDGFNLWRSRD